MKKRGRVDVVDGLGGCKHTSHAPTRTKHDDGPNPLLLDTSSLTIDTTTTFAFPGRRGEEAKEKGMENLNIYVCVCVRVPVCLLFVWEVQSCPPPFFLPHV